MVLNIIEKNTAPRYIFQVFNGACTVFGNVTAPSERGAFVKLMGPGDKEVKARVRARVALRLRLILQGTELLKVIDAVFNRFSKTYHHRCGRY